jgi:hypothetical protein
MVALEPISQALRIVGFVGDQAFGRHDSLQERHGDVCHVARCQGERNRSAKTIGQAQWILLVKPPRERPMAWLQAPVSASGRAVCLHVRGIEHQLVGDRACGCDLGKQWLPDTALEPPVVAVVDRRVRAVRGGRILPAAADLQHMQDAADHPPIVDPSFARLAVRQMWLDPCPGFIRKPE